MQLLIGHTSPETAFLVEDYPYGFRLRCKIRYWLEYKPKHGFRLVSQTTNPKRGDKWNTPKASTYARFAGAMFLDDDDHVQWDGIGEYSDATEAINFRDKYGEAIPEEGRKLLAAWIAAKVAYEKSADTPEARLALAIRSGVLPK